MENSSNSIFTGERFVPGIDNFQLEIEHFQRYYSVLPLVKGKVALDAACGEGYGSKILADAAQRVIGVDISEDAVNRARKAYSDQTNLSFIAESVADLSLPDESVDIVVSFETIEHISEELQQEFLEQIHRVLKKDGLLVMSTPNKEIYSNLHNYHNEFHVKEFYKEDFLAFLHQKFTNIVLYNQYFEVTSVIDRPEEKAGWIPYRKNKVDREGKYYIALASNVLFPQIDISHVYMNKALEYEERISRILSLQGEVEEKNHHLNTLDAEIVGYRGRITCLEGVIQEEKRTKELLQEQRTELETELEKYTDVICEQKKVIENLSAIEREFTKELQEYQQIIRNKEDHIKQLLESEHAYQRQLQDCQQTIRNKEDYIKQLLESENAYQKQLQDCQQTIRNKEGHIELLLETEREYEREKRSRTYRMALVFRKISMFFLPVNSKRRFGVKMLMKGIRHPKWLFRMVNLKRIKNCLIILHREGAESAANHLKLIEEYENSRSVPLSQRGLDIVEVSKKEKKISDYTRLLFPGTEKPQVSIIIPVYNQFEYTYHCLEAILKNSGRCKYEIVIADDCSTDLTQDLEAVVDGVRVIHNEKNLRFLLNCNNAARYAKGEYILFLNNDTQVQEGWLESLISVMETDEMVGMVGSKLIYSDGYLQEAGGILWKDASAWNYGNRQNPGDSEFNYVHEVDYISGAAVMIRTSLWKEIGGFDERFAPAYCEDSDLAFEVRRQGYKVIYQPKSVVVHFEGISNGTDVNSGQKKYQVENQQKFYDKWKEELEKKHFDNGTNVFLARDRSRDRKHVLVIDHYVPQYDKDAGSKTTFMYLRMLVKKGFHITFLGDNFYQHEPYTTELQQMGIFVLYGPKYAEHWKEWLKENITYFDVFYLNRPHISVKYIDFIKERARGRIIYYGHDLHFLRLKREYEINGKDELLAESEEWLKQELYLMHRADISYYPSAVEVEEIHKLDPTISVKAITAYVYEEFPELNYSAGSREGLLFVGGFGHDPNLDAVLWFVKKIYPEIFKRTGALFYIVGSKAPEEIKNLTVEGVVVKGFVTEGELKELYASCKIAVVPLRYGAGVKGKVVEALYYGIPIVTTPVGAEGILGIEDIAIVHENEEDLSKAIIDIYHDDNRLQELSHSSRQFVKERFSTEAVWNIIQEDFSRRTNDDHNTNTI